MLPYCSSAHRYQPQTARTTERRSLPKRTTRRECPLRGQTMAIDIKPQITGFRQNNILHMHKQSTGQHLFSLDLVLYDWNVLGIFCGLRLYEWTQNASDQNLPLTSADGLLLAFILPYVTFLVVDLQAILQSWSSEIHDTGIEFVQFQWRNKKNLTNGEAISQDRYPGLRPYPLLASL